MIETLEHIPPMSFPPSFEGNPFTYGFALFSLTLITALSLAQLLHYLFEVRARRAGEKIAENSGPIRLPFWSPINVHRMIVAGFLITVLLGAAPDVILLMCWGEATNGTMQALYTIDRFGDGLTVVPFLSSIYLITWAYQVLPQAIMRQAHVPLARPTLYMVRDKLKIVATVLLIAVGVTLGKAYA